MEKEYQRISISHIIDKCINEYNLPNNVAQQIMKELSDELQSGKKEISIKKSITVNGIRYGYQYYDRELSRLRLETKGKDGESLMEYKINYSGDYFGSALCHFYFKKDDPYLLNESVMTVGTNIRPCENADENGIDAIILLRRECLLTKMLYKNDKSLPDKFKLLQKEFIRDVLIKNGVCKCYYKDETGISINERGSTIRDNVYKCTITNAKDAVKISFYIDKNFKAHLMLENIYNNNLMVNDIPQNILDIVREKIREAQKLGVDISDIPVKFRQVQQEAKKQPTTHGTTGVVGSGHADR